MSGWLSRRLLAYVIIAVLGFFAVVWISPGWVVRIAQSVTMGTESNGLVMLLLLPGVGNRTGPFGVRKQLSARRTGIRPPCAPFGLVLRVASYLRWARRRPMGHSWRYRRIYSRSGTTGARDTLGLIGRVGMIEPETVRRTIRYARFAGAAAVANSFVWSRIEIFFLDRYWGREEIAFFSIALMLSSMASQGPALLTGALRIRKRAAATTMPP